MILKKKKRDLMPARIKRAKKELEKLSHDFVRARDSHVVGGYSGPCFDCGKHVSGAMFQCGHWVPNSVGGALLRYHPHNMHGQASGCNCGYQQEYVKINYTKAMIFEYGMDRVEALQRLKNRSIKADIIFYETMVDLYKKGDEQAIVDYLENL